jgi:Flp pilus assembly protein TadB
MIHKSLGRHTSIRSCLIMMLLGITIFLSNLLLSGLFLSDLRYRIALCIPASIILFFGARLFMQNRQRNDKREQYRVILSHLLAQVSVGRTLEQSLLSARSALSSQYQAHHPLNNLLLQMERQILANQTVGNAIDHLIESMDCAEATVGLGILRRISLTGSALLTYLRQAYQALVDLLEISRDIAAQNARTSAEASILAIMPFILAGLLRNSDGYLEPINNQPAGVIAFGAAFLLSVLALSLIPGLVSPCSLTSKNKLNLEHKKEPGKPILLASRQLRRFMIRILGDDRNRRTDESLMRVFGETSLSKSIYDVQKLQYFCVGLFLGILFAISFRTPLILPIPAVILIIAQDQLLFRLARREELALLSAFPFFLHICVSLLEAGLTVHHVLNLVSGAFSEFDSGRARTPMMREVRSLNQSLRTGFPVDLVLDQFALKSVTSELRTSYQLLSRFSQLGGQDLLHQLLQQTHICWSVYRNASRSRLNERSLAMLLPMMIDLFVIMIISITPAVLFLISGI